MQSDGRPFEREAMIPRRLALIVTLAIEWRYADGNIETLAAQADEIVRLNVDAIFAVSTPATQAAKRAATAIPIVIARVADPAESGL
jgi:putative tryptophan/tyrosine transport system substrate-binding protein